MTFIIPLKARAYAADWRRTCDFLNGTLRSIQAQTSSSYHVLLVCTDRPRLDDTYRNMTCLETDIAPEGDFDSRKGRLDKQRKILCGLIHAKSMNPEAVMPFDADDLIHRKLVEYVCERKETKAFIINRGFRYEMNRARLRKSVNYHLISGSSIIYPYLASDLRSIASHNDVDAHFITRAAHPKPADRILSKRGIDFEYIPFYAGIYIRGHGDSLRDTQQRERSESPANVSYARGHAVRRIEAIGQKIYGRLLGTQPLDSRIEEDFMGLVPHRM